MERIDKTVSTQVGDILKAKRLERSAVADDFKYQFKPFYGSSHHWALEYSAQLPRTSKVLDIGCARGSMGAALAELGFTKLFGAEPDDDSRAQAAKVYSAIESDYSLFTGEKFDLIFLLDVLEHMNEPSIELPKILSLLNSGGTLLVSVPNIVHWSIRLSVLFGRFEYTRRGILDRTHRVFFTRKSIVRMISEVPSTKVDSVDGSIAPLQFLLPEKIANSTMFSLFSRMRRFLVRVFPGLLSFQILVAVRKE